MARRNYCIDASSLLKMKEDFPRKVFPALWDRMEKLIKDGRLFAPEEVFKEIESDDEISAWAVQQKIMMGTFGPLPARSPIDTRLSPNLENSVLLPTHS